MEFTSGPGRAVRPAHTFDEIRTARRVDAHALFRRGNHQVSEREEKGNRSGILLKAWFTCVMMLRSIDNAGVCYFSTVVKPLYLYGNVQQNGLPPCEACPGLTDRGVWQTFVLHRPRSGVCPLNYTETAFGTRRVTFGLRIGSEARCLLCCII